MFYRGRLWDNSVKVLVIGQEGAQDESLARRAFTGGTGARMQHLLNHLGITQSYLFLNTFVYPIYGQYDASMRWLAQHPDSPVVQHRHALFNYASGAKQYPTGHRGWERGPRQCDHLDPIARRYMPMGVATYPTVIRTCSALAPKPSTLCIRAAPDRVDR
jgi:hypothetical protein